MGNKPTVITQGYPNLIGKHCCRTSTHAYRNGAKGQQPVGVV